ncbi:hypothetical protein, partial [Anaplasma bovis]|uniref:hypothetical protein n=1 Tax=Anaplasma bovis TaxID=186733 RepID=UPI002FEEFA39
RGDGDEEGIYLLAKDLAYNVALDQTDKLTEGIQKLSHKGLYDVKEEINSLDPGRDSSTSAIKKKICGTGAYQGSSGASGGELHETKGKCGESKSGVYSSSTDGDWDVLWASLQNTTSHKGGNYERESTAKKIGKETSEKISQDIRGLTREQHGVVSSAFAKAHEGAEIVEIRSISTGNAGKGYSHNYALLP